MGGGHAKNKNQDFDDEEVEVVDDDDSDDSEEMFDVQEGDPEKDDCMDFIICNKDEVEEVLAEAAKVKLQPTKPAPKADEDEELKMPTPKRPDWDKEMKTFEKMMTDKRTPDEEKVRLLHEALTQRIEDTKALDENKTVSTKRQEDSQKEKDRCRSELNRALAGRTKLEATCRELQAQKMNISKENQRIAEEERTRHTELKDKFQQAIRDVQEKMDAELEVRQHFLRENEELRGKLAKFTETYEEQERQIAEQQRTRETEMITAQRRLREQETMCADSKIKTATLEKQNEVLRRSQTALRAELQTILSKFDEFQGSVTGSNQRHSECKSEIDDLQDQVQTLETENADLKANATLTKLQEEQQTASKQSDALNKLCNNYVKETQKLRAELTRSMKNGGRERDK